MVRQEQPIDHGEAAVVRRQGVGRPAEVIEGEGDRHSRLRTAHSSGNAGWKSVDRRHTPCIGAVLVADGALDHLHVSVPPLLEALVEVDEVLGELGGPTVVAVGGEHRGATSSVSKPWVRR